MRRFDLVVRFELQERADSLSYFSVIYRNLPSPFGICKVNMRDLNSCRTRPRSRRNASVNSQAFRQQPLKAVCSRFSLSHDVAQYQADEAWFTDNAGSAK